tara:strand:+ start:4108 stop:4728 length:621 start_codon:yes stop_codon:yes gene_type:complete
MKEQAKTYITSRLADLVNTLPVMKILYKYDSLSKEHLVKVLPINEYRENTTYQLVEEDILFDFIKKFPFDNLVFLSDNDWIDINEPDEIFEGSKYSFSSNAELFENNTEVHFLSNELFSFSAIDDNFLSFSEGVFENYCAISSKLLDSTSFNNSMIEDFYAAYIDSDNVTSNHDKFIQKYGATVDTVPSYKEHKNEEIPENFALAA